MSKYTRLLTKDDHHFEAFVTRPSNKVKGGIVIIQEIFGVNNHIKEVCNHYSKQGYLCISPCLFDRQKPKIELGYDDNSIAEGRRLKELCNDVALEEIEASISYVRSAGKVSVIGYCWGGSLAWRAACSFDELSASIVYYGGDVPKLSKLKPRCEVICHFGELDKSIPINLVNDFKTFHKNVRVYTYPADHGFNCDHRIQYNPKCAEIAFDRSIKFLETFLT